MSTQSSIFFTFMQLSMKGFVQGYLLPKPSYVNIKGMLQRSLMRKQGKGTRNIKQMFLNIGSNTKKDKFHKIYGHPSYKIYMCALITHNSYRGIFKCVFTCSAFSCIFRYNDNCFLGDCCAGQAISVLLNLMITF